MPHARIVQTYAQTEACSSITFHDLTLNRVLATDLAAGSAATGDGSAAAPLLGTAIGRPGAVFMEVALRPIDDSDSSSSSSSSRGSSSEGGVVPMELVTRGPHVMLGYWRQPEASAAALLPGGWLRTGDLAVADRTSRHGTSRTGTNRSFSRNNDPTSYSNRSASASNYYSSSTSSAVNYRFVGRLKDLVKSGGESVVAVEVETVLLAHFHVVHAAVFGYPDSRWGERVVAALVLKPGHPSAELATAGATSAASTSAASSSAERGPPPGAQVASDFETTDKWVVVHEARTAPLGLHAHCAARLSGFKVPKQFLVVPPGRWPTTATGKVQKHKLLHFLGEALRRRAAMSRAPVQAADQSETRSGPGPLQSPPRSRL
jgi:acyl-CoA synthetase (AMP-forming)/AMP-acid ligase II